MSDLVCVVMPVHNGGATLWSSAMSILAQTWRHLHLVVVDDGSTDDTGAICARIRQGDPDRVLVIGLGRNRGVAAALNVALDSGPAKNAAFIARADADDVYDRQRIAKQVGYLNRNPAIDICGTSVSISGRRLPLPIDPCLAHLHMFFYCSLAHPTVMWRRSSALAPRRYDDGWRYSVAEDYRLWLQLLLNGARIANISHEPLSFLSRSASSISVVHGTKQADQALAIARDALADLVGDPDLALSAVAMIRDPIAQIRSPSDAVLAYRLLDRIRDAFPCPCGVVGRCDVVNDDIERRSGEIAIIASRVADPGLLQEWITESPVRRSQLLQQLLSP